MSIAIFDVDRTLIKGNSLILAAKKSNTPIELIYHCLTFIPYLIGWKLRLISTKQIKELFELEQDKNVRKLIELAIKKIND